MSSDAEKTLRPDPTALGNVRPAIRGLHEELIALRRDFHRHPEPGFEEERTAGKVADFLAGCGDYAIRTGVAKTGVVADIAGSDPDGPWVLLRADMDALRVHEENTEIEYCSQNPGVMHACGHDAHTAMLLGVARFLATRRDALKGGVRLIFQPAEEGPGGAEPMIREGVLENPRPVAALGIHVWSKLPTGHLAITEGPVMASTDELRFTIRGKGGHGAVPQETVDPIVAAAHYIVALQTIVSRNVNPLDSAVLSIGKITGGSIMNAIAEQVCMDGTQRSYLPETRDLLMRRMNELARGLDQTYGTETRVEVLDRYPATINDVGVAGVLRELVGSLIGPGCLKTDLRLMGGEDMAYYLEEIPGCFLFLGAGDSSRGLDRPHHNPRFNIDEDALPVGVEVFVRFIEHYVGAGLGD